MSEKLYLNITRHEIKRAFCLHPFLQPKVRVSVLSYQFAASGYIYFFLFCVELNYKSALFCKMPDCSEGHLKMICGRFSVLKYFHFNFF